LVGRAGRPSLRLGERRELEDCDALDPSPLDHLAVAKAYKELHSVPAINVGASLA
jgi:hypothetical protein